MKPQELEAIFHYRNHDPESIRMGLSASDFQHLVGVLTNLYSDRVMAVVREYMTNAYDSHVEAGNPNPIEVTLPTPMSLKFTVKDQGVGLGLDDLRNVYSMYGKSTKRNSDEMTGILGLGCKAALAYAVSFTVTAVKSGLKTIAMITKDADGVGSIQIMDTSATDESNGVVVTVPVRSVDVGDFSTKANHLGSFWQPGTVLINGVDPSGLPVKALWIDPDIAVFPGDASSSRVVMGNVAYPFTPKKFYNRIVAFIPMGSVHFTPSRESLQHNRQTDETLAILEDFVIRRFGTALAEDLMKAQTNFERARLFASWRHSLPVEARKALRIITGTELGTELRLHGHGWAYNKNSWSTDHYRPHEASKINYLTWDSLLRTQRTIVTHFPALTLTRSHRTRLDEVEITSCDVVPSGTDLSILEGRENVVSWNDILQRTERPETPHAKRLETEYQTFYNGHSSPKTLTALQELAEAGQTVLWYEGDEYNYKRFISVFSTTYIVLLRRRSTDRLTKAIPSIKSVYQFQREIMEYVRDSLTSLEDRIKVLSENRDWCFKVGVLRKIPVEDLEDETLAFVVSCIQKPATPVVAVAIQAQFNHKEEEAQVLREILQAYPLIQYISDNYNGNEMARELVCYLNAKHGERNNVVTTV